LKDASPRFLSDIRQAGHNYFLMERFEAGLVLTGTEVKAARDGKVAMKDAYGAVLKQRGVAGQRHISQYSTATARITRRCATASCCCTAGRWISSWG